MFFTFDQNNSGGTYVVDLERGVAQYVVIEAASAEQANSIAVDLDIYFGGVDDGLDCSCCGDRWYPQQVWDTGDEEPQVNGYLLTTRSIIRGSDIIFIHYLDGRVEQATKGEL